MNLNKMVVNKTQAWSPIHRPAFVYITSNYGDPEKENVVLWSHWLIFQNDVFPFFLHVM